MARSRNIKPGFFTNDILGELEPLARLLFAGLWCHADREGRLEDRPKKLKAEILPYDDCDVNRLMQCLHDAGMVLRYVVDGSSYIQIIKFEKHQHPHVKEGASAIPAPDKHRTSTGQNKGENRIKTSDSLNPITDSLNPSKDRSPTGSRFSLTDLPDDWKTYCETERADLAPDRVFEDFRDYWISVAGAKGRKLDWFATWRTWVRRQDAGTKKPAAAPWWTSDASIQAKGRELGMAPNPGESWQQFRGRINERLGAN